MKRKISKVVLTIMLTLPYAINAQSSNFGNWLVYNGNKIINAKWNLHNEIQYRNYNALGDLEQLLIRTGLGYTFNEKKSNVLLGYGYILSKNYIQNTNETTDINEHRIFQQFISRQQIGIVKINHRYRFEQRFIENDFKMRFRYFLGIKVPFTKSKHYYVATYNEIFLNTQSNVFDRNRLYGGIGCQINKNIKLEAGYMNQFFETTSRDQLNLITFVTF